MRGKTDLINYHTGNTGDVKAQMKIKKAAALVGCPFILMTSDKSIIGNNSNRLGGMQAIKTGIGHRY